MGRYGRIVPKVPFETCARVRPDKSMARARDAGENSGDIQRALALGRRGHQTVTAGHRVAEPGRDVPQAVAAARHALMTLRRSTTAAEA